ncbi:MAG: methyltransferase [Bacteroidota bacterium]|nr:methyltransferase [Bacteroidota bacterium]
MKVCTDSCLFGAWIADKIEKKVLHPENILDIGSGTGLLSLMLAQKSNAPIDAVEINENSFLQTKENFNESKWNKHLQACHADIKNWSSPIKYDLIISNPPFFENDLKSENPHKNLAKHNEGLNFAELLQAISNHLAEVGYFALLLPFHRVEIFKKMATENHFYVKEECLVKQTPAPSFFRGLLLFSTQKENSISKELIIKEKEGNYTKDFDELLKDYYL